jgi:hypothetical protein
MPDIFVAEPETRNTTVPEMPYVLEKQAGLDKPIPIIQPPINTNNPVHLFSAFKKNPDGITFRDQEGEETILLFIRHSFITNIRWILVGIFLAVLPLLILLSLGFFQNPLPSLPGKFYFMIEVFYYLFVATYLYINFITWHFNIALVTNKRIIDINFSNLVYKDVAATKLNLVQDVSFAQVGAIRTFFDYGDVLVQTAGTLDNFTFESAPQPENIVHVIEDLIGKRNERIV